jgi:hypothetical protein
LAATTENKKPTGRSEVVSEKKQGKGYATNRTGKAQTEAGGGLL